MTSINGLLQAVKCLILLIDYIRGVVPTLTTCVRYQLHLRQASLPLPHSRRLECRRW